MPMPKNIEPTYFNVIWHFSFGRHNVMYVCSTLSCIPLAAWQDGRTTDRIYGNLNVNVSMNMKEFHLHAKLIYVIGWVRFPTPSPPATKLLYVGVIWMILHKSNMCDVVWCGAVCHNSLTVEASENVVNMHILIDDDVGWHSMFVE